MSIIGDLLLRLVQPLLDALKKALGPFGKLFDIVTRFWDRLSHCWENGTAFWRLVFDEINAWKTFKEAIPVKYGVISVPAAVGHTRELVDQIKAAWAAIKDAIAAIKALNPKDQGDPAQEAREAIDDIEKSGFKTLIEKFPKLAKGAESALTWLLIVVQILESFLDLIDDLTTIVEATQSVREEIETGSTIFLKQSNRRRTVTLEDGTKMKIRIGNLHT
jgi:hypothetical protein